MRCSGKAMDFEKLVNFRKLGLFEFFPFIYFIFQCNRLLRWCPAADCGHVVEVGHLEARPVKCTCGTVFCFACGHEWHEPVNCRLLKLWIKKCNDDSETSNWISANTKECPKCQVKYSFNNLPTSSSNFMFSTLLRR